jgi:flagellar biosynthetic protein FliQ
MDQLASIAQQALYLTLIVSGPPVLLSLLGGFVVGIFQATTQIQEHTLTFAPKVILVFGFLAIGGPWVGGMLVRFTHFVFDKFPVLIR